MAERIKTIFILGAGASKDAGVPLMAEFLDVARGLFRSDAVGARAEDFRIVFDALSDLQAVHSKSQLDVRNIEAVFSTFEFARIINSFCGYKAAEIPKLAEAAKGLIAHTIEETLKFPVIHSQAVPPTPYSKFASMVQNLMQKAELPHSVSVITFNYDFAADFAFQDFPHVNHGLSGAKEHPEELSLLKLHGSVNWAMCAKCANVVPMDLKWLTRNRTLYGDNRPVRFRFSERLQELVHCKVPVASQPVLVPPTWNKSGYHQAVAPIWSMAALELAEADNIIIIGYSLPETDMFFRQLYALGTVGKHLLEKFWVFNPDNTGAVESRFASLLGPGAEQRFRYFPETFARAIRTLSDEFHVTLRPSSAI